MGGVDPGHEFGLGHAVDVQVDDDRILAAADHDALERLVVPSVELLVRDERRYEDEGAGAGLCGEFVNLDEKGKAVTSEDLARAKREKHPIKLMMGKNEKTGEEEPIALRKTLQLNYVIYGDEKFPEKDEVVEKGQKWIMR